MGIHEGKSIVCMTFIDRVISASVFDKNINYSYLMDR